MIMTQLRGACAFAKFDACHGARTGDTAFSPAAETSLPTVASATVDGVLFYVIQKYHIKYFYVREARQY